MKVNKIEIFHVSMPLIYPFRTAFGNNALHCSGASAQHPLPIGYLPDQPFLRRRHGPAVGTWEFARLSLSDWHGKEKPVTEQIVVVYDNFHKALSKITASLAD